MLIRLLANGVLLLIHAVVLEVTISLNETEVIVEEGNTVVLIFNIDTGVVVGNLTLMVTDGTTSMGKSKIRP